MEGWKNKILPNGARVLLLHQVLMSLTVHLLSTIHAPLSMLKNITRSLSNFFGGVKDGKPRKHWKPWDKLCLPTFEGGRGFRNLQDVQKSLFMKFAWK